MNSSLLAASLLLGAAASSIPSALAQPAPSARAPARIQVQVQISRTLAAGPSTEEQIDGHAQMRRSLYEMAAKECAALEAVFRGTCRLASLNVTGNTGQRHGPGVETATVSANATYELSPSFP